MFWKLESASVRKSWTKSFKLLTIFRLWRCYIFSVAFFFSRFLHSFQTKNVNITLFYTFGTLFNEFLFGRLTLCFVLFVFCKRRKPLLKQTNKKKSGILCLILRDNHRSKSKSRSRSRSRRRRRRRRKRKSSEPSLENLGMEQLQQIQNLMHIQQFISSNPALYQLAQSLLPGW